MTTYYPEQTVSKYFYFRDADGTLFDPDTFSCTIYDPTGTSAATPTLSKVSTGKYQMDYNLPEDADPGDWTIKVTGEITASSSKGIELFKFRVEELFS